MKHVIPHDLGLDLARRAALLAWENYAARLSRYQPSLLWEDDTRARLGFQARGVRLSGTVRLTPVALELDFDVPFLLRPFSGRAIQVIDREAARWLAAARDTAE